MDMTDLTIPTFLIRDPVTTPMRTSSRAPECKIIMPRRRVKRPLPRHVKKALAKLGYTPGQIGGMDRDHADSTIRFNVPSNRLEKNNGR